jgi:MFS family permease
MDRRRVLVGVTVLISALALAIAFFGPGRPALLYALGLVYGGLAYTVYPLCAAHANDFADRRQVVGVSAGLLLAWSMGSIVAPMAASLSMAALGPSGLFYYVAVVAAALAGYALWRMTRRAAVPTDLAAPFVATPQTTPAAAELHPRAEPRSDQPESDKE